MSIVQQLLPPPTHFDGRFSSISFYSQSFSQPQISPLMHPKLPFFLFLCFHLGMLIKGYVPKDQNNEMDMEPRANGNLADNYNIRQMDQQQNNNDDDNDEKIHPLMIRMFMPGEKGEKGGRKTSRVLDGQMPLTVVDVDIMGAEKEKEGEEEEEEEEEESGKNNDSNELTAEELSQFEMEEKEIRRKPSIKQRWPLLPKRRWNSAVGINRKSVKLPPLHAKAAPILRTIEENSIEGEKREEGKEKSKGGTGQQQQGRQFWVNALKTLLMEFRRMHPEIAIGSSRNNGKKRMKEEELKKKNKNNKKWANSENK